MLDNCVRYGRVSLGVIPVPAFQAGYTFSDIQKKCNDYAAQKAIDDFKTTGKVSDLTSLQADIDACTSNMDSGRQVRQGLILASSFIGIGLLGFWLMKRR